MKSLNKRIKFENKAFTLVEMIVTITIIGIVLSLSVFGILKWQDWAQFKQENEYAQTLFIAAQNQLAEYAANGRLNEMKTDLRNGNPEGAFTVGYSIPYSALNTLTDTMGNPYSAEAVWPESVGKTKPEEFYDTILALRADASMYSDYLTNPSSFKNVHPESYWVYELVGAYVYDTSILEKGSICLEITPDDGQVFAVLYSDKNTTMEYRGASDGGNNVSIPNASYRLEAYREQCMVGFYDVDSLTKASKTEIVRTIELSKVELFNRETTYLAFNIKKQPIATQKMMYDVAVYDEATNAKMLAFTLDGTKIKNRENAVVQKIDIQRKSAKNNTGMSTWNEIPVLAYIDSDGLIKVVLDAADIQATTAKYNADIKNLFKHNPSPNDFSKSLSYFRFALDVGDVYCTVQAHGGGFTTTKIKKSNVENPVFAAVNKVEDKQVYNGEFDIANSRHLYNMRYIEEANELNPYFIVNGMGDGNRYSKFTFNIVDDIDFGEFQTNGWLFNSAAVNAFVFDEGDNRFNCCFPSFKDLVKTDEVHGNGHTISGISVSEAANAKYAIYTNASTGKLNNQKPVGLFVVNHGIIDDLKLDKVVSEGRSYVGGFVGINAGTIGKLETINTDDLSKVTGSEYVGGIVGFQMPANTNEMKISGMINSANVYGVYAVGGILGMVRNEFSDFSFDSAYNLSFANKSFLNQNPYSGLKVIVENCENYGPVYGVNTSELKGLYNDMSMPGGKAAGTEKPTEPKFIGGIVGYAYNHQYSWNSVGFLGSNLENVKINNCVSYPLYSDERITTVLSSKSELDKVCKGVYVGGIVGYSHFATITNSSTLSKNDESGFVIGNQYVGGIVGLNIGPASGKGWLLEGLWRDITKLFGGSDVGVNEANVIGSKYVGGVTGSNSTIKADTFNSNIDPYDLRDIILEPIMTIDYYTVLEEWTNKGVVIATDSYAGGITGYNAGRIYACNSIVNADKANKYFASLYVEGLGDYVGGIAGYNNGIIGNTEREVGNNGQSCDIKKGGKSSVLSSQCYVEGKKYVGGIVGYNDVDAIIEDYKITGGYVKGGDESYGVGGYVGLNSSVQLLEVKDGNTYVPRKIYANPNEVKGEYFVGGIIGANIINLANTDFRNATKINGLFKTDNFLGQLKGKAFTGGFVGYNALLKINNAEYTEKLQNAIISEIEKVEKDSSKNDEEKLHDIVEILENLEDTAAANNLAKPVFPDNCTFYLTGEEGKQTASNLGKISAQIYVGGVIGFCDSNSKLYVENVKNATQIVATKAIERVEEQDNRTTDFEGNEKKYTYSYAGGIIGKVSANVVLDECSNASTGSVTSEGTYRGSVSEINEGIIINCSPAGFGSSAFEYVGGICGLNKKDGLVKYCKIDNKTITGKNVVGGIVAENFGKVSAITITKGKISCDNNKGYGVAGMLVAVNGDGGEIIVSKDIKDINISSKGKYVGGIVGYNSGEINIKNISEKENDPEDKAKNIKEKNPQGTKIEYLNEKYITITGNVKADEYAGGAIGVNKSNNTNCIISKIVNEANVTAVNGMAGGIVANNAGSDNSSVIAKVENCINKGVVKASNKGNAGGITAENAGEIKDCIDYMAISAPKGMCGGITAQNREKGNITNCLIRPEDDDNDSFLVMSSMVTVGGIAAVNEGIISNCVTDRIHVENYSTSEKGDIGVIAGINEKSGQILFAADSDAIDAEYKNAINNCQAFTYSDDSNVGGVVGTNYGYITGADLNEELLPTTTINAIIAFKPNSGSIASFGGVAGDNKGLIRNLSVDGNVGHLVDNTFERLCSDAKNGYGGIAGFNGFNSLGLANESGKELITQITSDKNYPAQIKNCTFDGVVWAHGSGSDFANIGGITGVNSFGGLVKECEIGVCASENDSTLIYAGEIEKQHEYERTTTNYEDRNGNKYFKANIDNESHAYIGGISGVNAGKVLSCDNKKYSEDKVNVEAFTSHCGGVVGRNDEGGIVTGEENKTISTGKKWTVDAHGVLNDVGTGGIIATNYSGEAMRYVENYANVYCHVNQNSALGGICGRIEQNAKSYIEISNALNLGNIESGNKAGGMIGVIRFKGMRLYNCRNYGEIYCSAKDSLSAGLVAIWLYGDTEASLEKCENHGTIIGPAYSEAKYGVGGLVAKVEKTTANSMFFKDCVNTGRILRYKKTTGTELTDNNINTGGILSAVQDANSLNIYFDECRNYSNSESYGISYASTGNANIYLSNCLDTSGNSKIDTTTDGFAPLSLRAVPGVSVNNYYIAKKNGGSTATGNAYFTFAMDSPYRNTKQSNVAYDITAPISTKTDIYQSLAKGEQNIHIDVDYDNCDGMDSFSFYLASNHTYKYNAVITDENGNSITDGALGIVVKQSDNLLSNNKQTIDVKSFVEKGQISSKKIKSIDLAITGEAGTSLYGFSWTKVGSKVEENCAGSSNIYGTTFGLSSSKYPLKAYTGAALTNAGNCSVQNENVYFYNYLYYPNSTVRFTTTPSSNNELVDYTFDINYQNNAVGVDKLVAYLTTSDGKSTQTTLENYSYYYVVNYLDNSTAYTSATKNISKAAYREPIEIELNDSAKNVSSVDLYIKNTTASKKNISFAGFMWQECGNDKLIALCGEDVGNYGEIVSAPLRELLVSDETTTGAYDLYPAGADITTGNVIHMSGNTLLRTATAENGYYKDTSDYSYLFDLNNIGWDNNTRASLYKELDEKYREFIYSTAYNSDSKLNTPQKLAVTSEKGMYKFTWGKVPGAYEYAVYYELFDKDGNKLYTSAESTVSSTARMYKESADVINDIWSSRNRKDQYTIRFYVKAVSVYHKANSEKTDADKNDSDFNFIETKQKINLPRPEFHLEIVNESKVVFVLDNYEEYVELLGADLNKCELQFRVNEASTPTAKFVLSNGKFSDPFTLTSKVSSTTDGRYNAYAKSLDESIYMNSVATSMFGTCINETQFGGNAYQIRTAFDGFTGSTPDSLGYQITFTSNNMDMDMMSELVAMNDVLGIPVVYAYGLESVSNRSKADVKFATSLKGFSGELIGKDITIRTYPFMTQADVAMLGHKVVSNVVIESASDLEDIVDKDYIDNSGKNISQNIYENGKLKKGYSVRQNEDGTYDIIYSSALGQYVDASKFYQLAISEYNVAKDESDIWKEDAKGYNYYDNLLNTVDTGKDLLMQPEPEIGDMDKNSVNGHNSYKFVWDEAKSGSQYTGAKYSVELFGITQDGERISLSTIDSTSDKNHTFVDEQDNWNYVQFELQVVRLGDVNANNISTKLPRIARKEFDLKLRLDTKSITGAGLTTDENGEYIRDDLIYDIFWDGITDSGQLDDLAGYLITVYEKDAPVSDNNKHYYVVGDWNADAYTDGIVEQALDYNDLSASKQAKINLNDFGGGIDLILTLKSVAKFDSSIYMDSLESDEFELYLQARLDVPDVSKLSIDTSNSMPVFDNVADNYISEEEYEKGFTLKYADNDTYKDEMTQPGIYMAVSAFDQPESGVNESGVGTDIDKHKCGDAYEGAVEYWDSEALTLLATKAAPIKLTGNATNATGKINLAELEEYHGQLAGKWLKITLKSYLSSKLSSSYCDEDAYGKNTINYYWIHVPKLEMNDLGLYDDSSKDDQNNSILDNNIWYYMSDGSLKPELETDDNALHSFEVKTVRLDENKVFDSYKIEIIGKSVDNRKTDGSYSTPIYDLYVQKGEESAWDLYISSASDSASVTQSGLPEGIAECKNDSEAVYIGSFDSMEEIQYICSWDISKKYSNGSVLVDIPLMIKYVNEPDKEGYFDINLPDVTKVNGADKSGDENYFDTFYVIAEGILSEDDDNHRIEKSMKCWYREKSGSGWITNIIDYSVDELNKLYPILNYTGPILDAGGLTNYGAAVEENDDFDDDIEDVEDIEDTDEDIDDSDVTDSGIEEGIIYESEVSEESFGDID